MAKHDKKTGRSKDGKHVRLYRYVTRCEAWQSLDCIARCAYLEFLDRYNGPGSNNGHIPLSVRELKAALGIGNDTALRALRDLEARGFVVCTRRGGFNQKTGERRANEWRLTEHPCDVTGAGATKEFLTKKFKNTVRPQEPDGSASGTERFGLRNEGGANSAETAPFGSASGTAAGMSGSASGTLLVYQGGSNSFSNSESVCAPPASGRKPARGKSTRQQQEHLSAAPHVKRSATAKNCEVRAAVKKLMRERKKTARELKEKFS